MLMGLIALVILFMTRDATFTNDNFVGWALWQYIMTAVPFALITAGLSKNLGLATLSLGEHLSRMLTQVRGPARSA